MKILERFEEVLGAGEEWERPRPTKHERLADVYIALAFLAVAALGSELLRAIGAFADNPLRGWERYGTIVSAAVILVFRRSHPGLVVAAATLHLLVIGTMVPQVVSTLPMQILYFFAIYSGVAWARDRRVISFVVIGLAVATFAWLAWFLALSAGIAELTAEASAQGKGPIPPVLGVAAWIILNNVLYFGGAVLLGQVAWRGARRTAQVSEQARTIAQQTGRLRDQAVVAERLRIARELHDVVAHHISVMGVQAAAARRVLKTDQKAAGEALRAIEGSSRQAVTQMRDLLGTLRTGEIAADGVHPLTTDDWNGPDSGSKGPRQLDTPARDGLLSEPDLDSVLSTALPGGSPQTDRSPQPGLNDLAALVEEADSPQCRVSLRVVPAGADLSSISAPVQLSAYRIVQEALANVRKHSSAGSAGVVLRVEPGSGQVEVEIVNGGQARHGTSGTGLGHVGMTERARHLGGGVEMGIRNTGGYRVRAWFPVDGMPRRQEAVQ
ncbi:MAG: histidine kinase [Ornithinimicrobium sp.]